MFHACLMGFKCCVYAEGWGNGVTVNHLSVSGTSFVSSKHDGKLVGDLLQQITIVLIIIIIMTKNMAVIKG